MTSKTWITLLIVFSLHVGTISSALCEELKTRYATVRYDDINLLQKFNDEIYLGRQLNMQLRQQKAFTMQDELHNKLNLIVEKVETVLDMSAHPTKSMNFWPNSRRNMLRISLLCLITRNCRKVDG